MPESPKIILASSSPYRKALLERLQLSFESISPEIDETRLTDESPEHLVKRLSSHKAGVVAKIRPDALIIGSDQVAVLGDIVLGKPGNRENAIAQLQMMRGHSVNFITGLCLLNAATGRSQAEIICYQVCFRDSSDAEIQRYVDKETPYNCAGSFKSEQLGISLMSRMQGDDPTALIGLPLIKLSEMLRNEHINIP